MAVEQQAQAAWYPQEDGRQRYWDGAAWTEHFAPGKGQPATGMKAAAATLAGHMTEVQQPQDDPDALWQVVGKPLTGLGAGRYKLTARYLYFEKGTLSTDSQQVPIESVLDVDVKQSMTQKARGVGSITVHIQRATRVEIVTLADIPDSREGQRLINETAHAARLAIQQRQNTTTMNYQGVPPALSVAPTPVSQGELRVDPIEQLRQLAQLRDAGILTEDEFTSKKAEILGRL